MRDPPNDMPYCGCDVPGEGVGYFARYKGGTSGLSLVGPSSQLLGARGTLLLLLSFSVVAAVAIEHSLGSHLRIQLVEHVFLLLARQRNMKGELLSFSNEE